MIDSPQTITAAQETAAVELANEVSHTIVSWQKRYPHIPDDLAQSILQMIAYYGPMKVERFLLKSPELVN